jgi:hypothetical protein
MYRWSGTTWEQLTTAAPVADSVTHGDCPDGNVCVCSGVYGGNTCVARNCRVDADCGDGGYCSPQDAFCYNGAIGYFCHTPKDTCIDDTDCALGARCVHDAATGAWGCMMGDGCPL